MGFLREVRGEIEIPPPPLGLSGAGNAITQHTKKINNNQNKKQIKKPAPCQRKAQSDNGFKGEALENYPLLTTPSSPHKLRNFSKA